MSKQLPRKTTESARTPAKAGTSSGRTPANTGQPGRSSAGRAPMAQSRTSTRAPQAAGSARARQAGAAQRRWGRGIRNSDIASLFGGLVLGAGLVGAVLPSPKSGNSNNPPPTGTTGNPGAAPASTNAAS